MTYRMTILLMYFSNLCLFLLLFIIFPFSYESELKKKKPEQAKKKGTASLGIVLTNINSILAPKQVSKGQCIVITRNAAMNFAISIFEYVILCIAVFSLFIYMFPSK